jgi:UDP-N-acetylglucosamine transferase subunit ALG13
VIFVTLGTHEQPFDRALDLVSELPVDDEIVVQHGNTPARGDLHNVEWVEYLELGALTNSMRHAEVVVTHAGVGSTVTAVKAGKRPVMLPRLARFGEHVDDHQLQLAERFAENDVGLLCGPGDSLANAVSAARVSPPSNGFSRRGGLRHAVVAAAAGR